MRLSETNILKLLPEFMQTDEANVALSEAVNMIAIDAYKKIRTFSIWEKIDDLDDATLDELAYELGVSWYRSTSDIQTKREVIKASDLVHAKLGTPWAVEKLMGDYYGTTLVREWWIYGGEPGHFKLLSINPQITNEKKAEAMALLEICKRKSSKLDDVAITITGDQLLYMGAAVHDWTVETTRLGNVGEAVAAAAALATT